MDRPDLQTMTRGDMMNELSELRAKHEALTTAARKCVDAFPRHDGHVIVDLRLLLDQQRVTW